MRIFDVTTLEEDPRTEKPGCDKLPNDRRYPKRIRRHKRRNDPSSENVPFEPPTAFRSADIGSKFANIWIETFGAIEQSEAHGQLK